MEVTKHNRDNMLADFIVWAGEAYNSVGLSVQLDHRAVISRWGVHLGITSGGDGLCVGGMLGGWSAYVALRKLIPPAAWRPVRAWAKRRAELLSKRYSEGKPTWTTEVRTPGPDGEWRTELRYARQVFAHELDPSDGRIIFAAHLQFPGEESAALGDLRTWLHYSVWSGSTGDSSHNRRAPWNGTGWSNYIAWFWPWQSKADRDLLDAPYRDAEAP